MGVLDPLKHKASDMKDIKEEFFGMLDMTLENLDAYDGAILNDRYDIIEEDDPFFFDIWRDDIMDIDSLEELRDEKRTVKTLKENVAVAAFQNKFAEVFAEGNDVETDYKNPVESYRELDKLSDSLEGLIDGINDSVAEKTGLERDRLEIGVILKSTGSWRFSTILLII